MSLKITIPLIYIPLVVFLVQWKWIWVVNSFDSDSYYRGDYIELNPIADTQNGLIQTEILEFKVEKEDEDLDDDEEE